MERLEGNKIEAHRYFNRACTLHSASGCNGFADSYREQNKPVEVRRYYALACDYGDYLGCNNFGVVEELAGKTAEAKKFYKFSCDKGVAHGCRNSGNLAKKEGRTKDSVALMARAMQLFKTSCGAGFTQSCTDLKAMQEGSALSRAPASGNGPKKTQ